jgi:hypothetical protein
MVSIMESDVTPARSLAAVERANAALWTDYPPTPWWYHPAGGAWMAATVACLGAVDDPYVRFTGLVALAGAAQLFQLWYRRYRGAMPRLTSAPDEFKPAIRAFVLGALALVATVAVVVVVADAVLAGVALTFVGATAGLYAYERTYEAAARRTRDRLG